MYSMPRSLLQAAACILASWALAEPFAVKVAPCERLITTDEATGAELTYLSTHSATDTNLYFHERSWLFDESMILFNSKRDIGGGLIGYLTATGELAHLTTPSGGISAATAAIDKPSIYGLRANQIIELTLRIETGLPPAPSKVWAADRIVADAPEGIAGGINLNSDGTQLAFGVMKQGDPRQASLMTVNTATGELRTVCTLPQDLEFAYHVQWNHVNPFLLCFAAIRPRLNIVDVRNGHIQHPYPEWPGELVTHEHWWGPGHLVFCGGLHPKPTEDAHVKLLDIQTGQVRILGAGSWWPAATPEQIARHNFWHCAGSDNGRWVAADNWHGDITLFEGKTARPHLLTTGHRTYGAGEHPHVGWDRKGAQVVFTSHKLGNPNVCVAAIPKAFQEMNPTAPWN